VTSPGDVADDRSVAGDFHLDGTRQSITRNVGDGHTSRVMQARLNDANGSLNAMLARADPAQVRQRGYQADHSMPAHPQVADVVEKDDARGAPCIGRGAEERADGYVRAARFIDDRGAEGIELLPKSIAPLGQSAA